MSKRINIILIFAAVVVAIVAAVFTYSDYLKEKQKQQQELLQQVQQPSRLPPFATGEITKIEGDSIYLKGAYEASSEQELMGRVNSETVITKQILRNELPTLAQIQLTEVLVGNKVMIFYDQKQDNGFIITQLQVLD